MRPPVLALITAGYAALLTGCATPAGITADELAARNAEIVKAAKWDEMTTVTIELGEHAFDPANLSLKVNRPYRLVLKNRGDADHYYTAAEFFKSVAWRKAQTPRPHGGEVKAPYLSAVEVYKKGGTFELFIVPLKKGVFPVVCTIDDHQDKGMTGTITVD